jgi:autotransporter-associated beta strand protein
MKYRHNPLVAPVALPQPSAIRATALGFLLASAALPVYAQNGTWLGNGNAWNDTSAWSGGIIADGTGNTANFTGVDIAADVTMALGADRTIGNITFTDFTTPSHNLTLTGNILTLDVTTGAPIINVTQAGRTLTIDSVIAGTDALTKAGLGTLTMSGNNSRIGGTTMTAGTLKLDYSTNDTSKLNGTLGLQGGTLELSGGSHLEAVGGTTTLSIGQSFIKRTSGTAKLAMGSITYSSGAIDFESGVATTTQANLGSGILSTRVTVGGSAFAAKDGSNNIVAYTSAAAYTGGSIAATSNHIITGSGTTTLAATTGNATNTTLQIANTGAGTLDLGANALTVSAILFSGSADYAITTSGAGKVSAFIHNYGTGGAVLSYGALGNALAHFGTGKTILTAASTFNGNTNIQGGTLQISDNLQLSTGGQQITLNTGTLLASEDLTLQTGATARPVILGASGGTLAAAPGKTLTVPGVISGLATSNSSLTIGNAGSTGTIVLSGVNTYAGNTIVDTGTLVLADNAQLKFVLGTTSGANNSITGAGTVTLEGDFNIDTSAADALSSGTWTLENVAAGSYGTNFTVFGFTDAGSNKWTKANGATTYTFDEATGILTLGPSNPYLSWPGGTASNFAQDSNNDGVPNGLAWILGAANASDSALNLLPTPTTSGGNLTLSPFNRVSPAGTAKLFVEYSTNLITWFPFETPSANGSYSSGNFTVTIAGTSPQTVGVTVSSAAAADGKLFVRLRATEN